MRFQGTNTFPEVGHLVQRTRKCGQFIRSQGFESAELSSLADALQRYHYYVEAGVHVQHLIQLESQWLQNILSLVPRDTYSSVSNESYDTLIELAVEEVQTDFACSMRKAIIDYLLKNPVERRYISELG